MNWLYKIKTLYLAFAFTYLVNIYWPPGCESIFIVRLFCTIIKIHGAGPRVDTRDTINSVCCEFFLAIDIFPWKRLIRWITKSPAEITNTIVAAIRIMMMTTKPMLMASMIYHYNGNKKGDCGSEWKLFSDKGPFTFASMFAISISTCKHSFGDNCC